MLPPPYAGSITITIRRAVEYLGWQAVLYSPDGEYNSWSGRTKKAARKLAEAYASAQNWYVSRVYQ